MKINEVIISKTIYLKRNLQNYNFAISLSDKKAMEIFSSITHELEKLSDVLGEDYAFEIFPLSTMDYLELKKLEAKKIIPYSLKNNVGRGVAICKKCFVLINFDDHITIGKISNGKSLDFDEELDILYKVENALQQYLPFAFDDELGFLTSCTDYFGTGLLTEFLTSFYFMINGEKYIKELHTIFKGVLTLRITEKIHNRSSPSQFIFYTLNEHSHYKNVESQMEKTICVINKAIEDEIYNRDEFIRNAYDEAYDFVLRAFLVAQNSLLVPEYNLIDLLATIRFGISEKIVKNITLERIDELFINLSTPFVVEKILNDSKISIQDISVKMIDKMRANILRKEFKNIKIKEYDDDTKFF